jgi:elongation factor P
MLSYSELRKGVVFVYEGAPYEVVDSGFLRMQQRKAVMQTKMRNLVNGKVLDRNFTASDSFEEADVDRKPYTFLYKNKGEYWFADPKNPKDRFSLAEDVVGDQGKFAKDNTVVEARTFNDKIISVKFPIKMDLTVKEAPPGIKGNTAQGGTKQVTLETGAVISVPMFIEAGEVIRVNTETGEYVERVK